MNILFAASEVAPFIKTGGLADVAGSLPQALAAQGHDVRVVLPLYEGISGQWREQMTFLFCYNITLAWRTPYCGVFQLERDGVTYYFIDNEFYFKRKSIYGHYDDGERFAYFSRAVIELCGHLDWHADVIHANDWQCALIPIYLLEARNQIPQLYGTRSVYTIHNIEYQGRYGRETLVDLFGLNEGYFNEKMLAYYGDVNLMKGAIYAADFITTVSPTYARELQFDFYAHGLAGVVCDCSSKIQGILNGLDTKLYDPATDPAIAKKFSPGKLAGKKLCKSTLQERVGLEMNPDVPLIACVSRLVSHKGFDLVTTVLDDIMGMGVQMVVLGTGEWRLEEAFRHAAWKYPGRFSAQIAYSADLSSAIYAGADLFLMPSIAEPCGLSQLIAMRYGTVPIVRETGGLRDTVISAGLPDGRGFTFADINAHDMAHVVWEAAETYRHDPERFQALQKAGMTADFSWNGPAEEYVNIYQRITG